MAVPAAPTIGRHQAASPLPADGLARTAVLAVLGVEPLDLGRELCRLAGQFPRELQRRLIDLAVGDTDRDRGRSGRDVQDRISLVIARTSHDPALLKPSPHLITQAVETLDAEPGECTLVGDSVTDVQGARLAGIQSIGYANKPGKRERLVAAGADATINSLADLALKIRARVADPELLQLSPQFFSRAAFGGLAARVLAPLRAAPPR